LDLHTVAYISQSETLKVSLEMAHFQTTCMGFGLQSTNYKAENTRIFNLSNMGKPIWCLPCHYNHVFPYTFLSLPHFNLLPLTFSSPEHLSRQLLWSLAQSKMIKALPEAGTGKKGGGGVG